MLKIELTSSICHSFRLIMLIFHAIIFIHLLYEVFYLAEEEVFNRIQGVLTAIVSCLSYTFYVWYYNALRLTCLKLRKVDHSFKLIGVKPTNDSNKSSGPVQLLVCVILIAIYFYTKYLRKFHSNIGLSTMRILKSATVRTFFVSTNGYVMLTFVNKVHIGRLKFEALNQYVENLVEGEKKGLIEQDIMDDINSIYLQIVEYCDKIRSLFQVQIFVTSMNDLFIIIYMLLTVFNEFVTRPVTTASIIFCLVDPLYRILRNIVIINAAVAATRQARQMADCLQRLMIETLLDSTMKEKIRLFLMEMVDKKLVFIVCGFLTLNYETLVAMMGTITTYLLIMMQFRPPGDTSEEDNNDVAQEDELLN